MEKFNTQGVGMGLHIAENIIKQFNGNIGVYSVLGKGSKFVFSFEIKEVDPDTTHHINDLNELVMRSENTKKMMRKFQNYNFGLKKYSDLLVRPPSRE